MANEYVNELEINGQKRLDLTQDTATPETVLKGETFHQKSGAPAVGTYSPSDEIEARLEATVGHSSKNLISLSGVDETWYGVRWYEQDGQLKAVGTYNDNAAHTRPRIQYYCEAGDYILNGSPNYSETGIRVQIGTCTDSAGNGFVLLGYDGGNGFLFTLSESTWISLRIWTSKELYQTVLDYTIPLMLRDGSISDDTFEPYVTPTDERIIALEARVAALEAIINNS